MFVIDRIKMMKTMAMTRKATKSGEEQLVKSSNSKCKKQFISLFSMIINQM